MSASSGITASQELLDQYALAMEPSANIRFMKIGISEEQLVPLGSWPVMANDLASDFQIFTEIVEENVPAYILAKLDGTAGWLFISYVPDTAKVRDKMLYASSRSAVTKALGGQAFADTMFTTAKSDLTPTAYASHLRHIAAPPPMSAREQELYNIKAAEKEMGEAYEGSRARKNHVGTTVGVKWSPEVEEAVTAVVSGQGKENLAVIALDPSTETLILTEKKIADVDAIASSLPTSEPSKAALPSRCLELMTCWVPQASLSTAGRKGKSASFIYRFACGGANRTFTSSLYICLPFLFESQITDDVLVLGGRSCHYRTESVGFQGLQAARDVRPQRS
ncbi:Twinfilin-1 [Tulasnella sp. JGI-2019a]|nr:Twinfilin-1 [Tulasnella sp. JGI-2019a]